ncbi:hypothetical protein AAHZ94_27000, partial [Streptomyces sp. HSW2009]|uniref:hypothetical protein n=1 Tax=Streptomyces sp. HSW2009 TaxID=3142890 RepID=UPI0032EF2994
MTACAIETAPQNHRATRSPQPDTAPRPAPDGPAGPPPPGGGGRGAPPPPRAPPPGPRPPGPP